MAGGDNETRRKREQDENEIDYEMRTRMETR